MKSLRGLALASLVGLATAASASFVSHDAQASVSIAVLFDELVKSSDAVAVFTPVEESSVWENGRIYTYTRVHTDTPIAGELGAGADAWIRTLGGAVGHIGQSVEGEAVLTVGRPALLFLHHGPPGAFEVSARAQGQYPVAVDPSSKRLTIVKAANPGALMTPPKSRVTAIEARAGALSHSSQSARDVLHGKAVDEASRLIVEAYTRLHTH